MDNQAGVTSISRDLFTLFSVIPALVNK